MRIPSSEHVVYINCSTYKNKKKTICSSMGKKIGKNTNCFERVQFASDGSKLQKLVQKSICFEPLAVGRYLNDNFMWFNEIIVECLQMHLTFCIVI